MKFSQMKAPSKYLAKEDIEALPNKAALATIRGFTQENLALKDKPPELKWIIWFNEFQKGMVLNPTNRTLLCAALGIDPNADDGTDRAIGKQIVVWVDMSVIGPNNTVGGLRLRAVRRPKFDPRPQQAQPTVAEMTQSTAAPPPEKKLTVGIDVIPGGGTLREPPPPRPVQVPPESIPPEYSQEYAGGEEFDDDIPF